MKRFFQPLEKDGSSKKPALSSETSSQGEDKDKNNEIVENQKMEPLKFITWNANSLLLRVKNNWPEFSKFVQGLDPDVIAIQEVRMPAAGSKGAPKNPGELKDDTSSSREEKQVLKRALSSPPFEKYQIWWSLADSKYAGTALLVKKCIRVKNIYFSLDQTAKKHEQDGRVILAEFESFRFLNTYVPNNGWKEEESSFVRRRKWDKRVLDFVLQSSDKPLIWCGDLNMNWQVCYVDEADLLKNFNDQVNKHAQRRSHEEIDVSHPDFFSAAKMNGYLPPNKEDRGQPGFTLSERMRFGNILKQGKLVDAYRHLHKEKDMERGFSWSGNPIGKYRGKRMRIDYFLVSETLRDRIVSCEMHGRGIELEGFYGSDHCPISLELLPSSPDPSR